MSYEVLTSTTKISEFRAILGSVAYLCSMYHESVVDINQKISEFMAILGSGVQVCSMYHESIRSCMYGGP